MNGGGFRYLNFANKKNGWKMRKYIHEIILEKVHEISKKFGIDNVPYLLHDKINKNRIFRKFSLGKFIQGQLFVDEPFTTLIQLRFLL